MGESVFQDCHHTMVQHSGGHDIAGIDRYSYRHR